jgi:hypothetical protein
METVNILAANVEGSREGTILTRKFFPVQSRFDRNFLPIPIHQSIKEDSGIPNGLRPNLLQPSHHDLILISFAPHGSPYEIAAFRKSVSECET